MEPFDLPVIQRASVEREDINQEAELLRLSGITPNKRIIRARLAGQSRELLCNFAPEEATPLGYLTQRPIPPTEVFEQLIDWTLAQTEDIQAALFNFFEDPEENIDQTLQFLQDAAIIDRISLDTPKTTSLAEIMRAALPATKESLSTLIRQVSPTTERPEATVRQFLRRGTQHGTLAITSDGLITRKDA